MQRLATASLALGLLAATAAAQGCFNFNIGTNLNLTDDSNSAAQSLGFSFTYNGVAYTQVTVCSNGYIWMGTTTQFADYTPTEAELLTLGPRICPNWEDFNPSVAGGVYFNAIPANGPNPAHALISWVGVREFGRATGAVDMQVKLDSGSNMWFIYGPAAPQGGTTNTQRIIGASPGVAAVSNPVSFATRPLTITQNNFAEVTPTAAFALTGVQMLLVPTNPGYAVADVPCTPGAFPPPA